MCYFLTYGDPGNASVVDEEVEWEILLPESHSELLDRLKGGQIQRHELNRDLPVRMFPLHLLLHPSHRLWEGGKDGGREFKGGSERGSK